MPVLEGAPPASVSAPRAKGVGSRTGLLWTLSLDFGGGDKGMDIICEAIYSEWCVRV